MSLLNGSRGKTALRFSAVTAALAALMGATLAVTPANAADAPITLVTTAGTTWNYLEDNTDPAGSNSDVNVWTKTPFVDTAWKTAKGSFGAKNGVKTGIGSYTANTLLRQYINGTAFPDTKTFFFRTKVNLTAEQLAGITGLAGSVTHDDAIRVFVNGTKVLGVDDSAATTNLQYTGVGAGDPKTSAISVPKSALVEGVNTIAVALYQDREASSDIYFDMTSLATTPIADAPTSAAISDVVLNVGPTADTRNFTWYSNSGVTEVVQVAKKSDVVGGVFPPTTQSFTATSGAATQAGSNYERATATGLAENTTYSYRVGSEALGWSAVYSFATQSFTGDYSFLLVGDPQIGASGNVANDQAGWVSTLNSAVGKFPKTEMIYSAGDQVETATSEAQYDAFLAPTQLRSIPLSTINGNHDVGSKAYEQHFNMPNWDPTYGAGSSSTSGGDYWYIYKDVLYMTLNSNSQDTASHKAFMEKVIAEHGSEAKWRVVGFHHSIYSVAAHSLDGDIIARRSALPTVLSDLDIDLVLMGHDHVYTRSYLMNKGVVAESPGAKATVVPKDGDVLYVTANSASGSKYYDINTSQNFSFAAVTNQEKIRNFSNVEVSANSLTVTTYRSDALTVIDKVTLSSTDTVKPTLTVPASSKITVGSSFDPLAGVSATDEFDGDLTSTIVVTGSVNPNVVGAYELTYDVKDAAGNTATASRTVTVAKGTFTTTDLPAITGTATVGSTLTATDGRWAPTPTTVSYQWLRGTDVIAGATNATYTLTVDDNTKDLSVRVTATKANYTDLAAKSAATTIGAGTISNTVAPTISGSAVVDQTVTATAGTWSVTPEKTEYQWLLDGLAVNGATSATYAITAKDAGKELTAKVTVGVSGYNDASATSIAQTVAKATISNLTVPVVSGAASMGNTLTASEGTWSTVPTRLSYQWLRDGAEIEGADEATYEITATDVDADLQVEVTASKDGYSSKSATSAAVAVVAGTIANTDLPGLTGSSRVGGTLTAGDGTFSQTPKTITYQWKLSGNDISGETHKTLLLDAAYLNRIVTVTVTVTADGYTPKSATSAGILVGLGTFTNTEAPIVTGTGAVDTTLMVNRGDWSEKIDGVTYQWTRNGVAVVGATNSTFALTAADADASVQVEATATKAGYTAVIAKSAAVIVAKGTLATAKPTISGTAKVGKVLTATSGTWAADAVLSYSWTVDNRTVGTAASFTIPGSLAGKKLTVKVTGVKAGYATASESSNATASIAKGTFTAAKPKISGTAKVKKALKVTVGTWTPKASYGYTWYANGKAIKGATKSTYTIAKSLKGKTITVKVTGSATGFTTKTILSAPTGKIKK